MDIVEEILRNVRLVEKCTISIFNKIINKSFINYLHVDTAKNNLNPINCQIIKNHVFQEPNFVNTAN